MPAYPGEIYFLNDLVTEDTTSVGFGEVWIYFFKETQIGVRDARNGVAYFMDADTKNDTKAPMAPTLANLTKEHVREAIEEQDPSAEKCHIFHISELYGHTVRILAAEMNMLLNEAMMGQD